MKHVIYLLTTCLLFSILISCEDSINEPTETGNGNVFVINYGTMSGSKSTISQYNAESDSVFNNAYQAINEVGLNSNVQYAAVYNGSAYLVSNDGDKIDIVDAKNLEATINPVRTGIILPRYIVFNNNTAYVSCWGESPDYENMPNSFIAVLNLDSHEVTETIALPGGPEGLAIANGKLYAALNYTDSIAVIDLDGYTKSFIETPAVSSYFLKDATENLYVSLVSTWSDPSDTTGIGYINTSTNELTNVFLLEGISSNYSSIMQFDAGNEFIYILASAWVQDTEGNWVQEGGLSSFDIQAQAINSAPFISGIDGINGFSVNPANGDIYCFIAGNEAGKMQVYSSGTELKSTHTIGLYPFMAVFTY